MLVNEHAQPSISLRVVAESDRRAIWEWANDPATRLASFSSRIITWQEHVRWFEQKQNDPGCIFLAIIEGNSGSLIGTVRHDVDAQHAYISINLKPVDRGKGYGRRAICLSSEHVFQNTTVQAIAALIKPSNLASIHAFVSAGFRHASETQVEAIPASKFILERKKAVEK